MKRHINLEGCFIDLGSVKIDGHMEFLKDGKWYRTSKIVTGAVVGTKVYVETKNSIYEN